MHVRASEADNDTELFIGPIRQRRLSDAEVEFVRFLVREELKAWSAT